MPTLLPGPHTLELVALHANATKITIVARACASSAPCPLCCAVSTHIHSRYHRRALDLPWSGINVRLDLTVRRFFCDMDQINQPAICLRHCCSASAPSLSGSAGSTEWHTR